jgi:outer membrane protein OmpA-like peptidoglycan-associated protein
VYFATGDDVLLPDSYPVLNQVAAVLKANPHLEKILIEGHTDDRGHAPANLELSQRRAAATREYLIKQGIDSDRLSSVGHGQTRPLESNETEAGRGRNRRVQFTILQIAGNATAQNAQ